MTTQDWYHFEQYNSIISFYRLRDFVETGIRKLKCGKLFASWLPVDGSWIWGNFHTTISSPISLPKRLKFSVCLGCQIKAF